VVTGGVTGRELPNTTCEFGDRTRTALAHWVGAGCCAGGTPWTHTRHIPVGGTYCGGTAPPSRPSRVPPATAGPGRGDAGSPNAPDGSPSDCPPSCWTRTAVACAWAGEKTNGAPHKSATKAITPSARRGLTGRAIERGLVRNCTDVGTPERTPRSTPGRGSRYATVGRATSPLGAPSDPGHAARITMCHNCLQVYPTRGAVNRAQGPVPDSSGPRRGRRGDPLSTSRTPERHREAPRTVHLWTGPA
jgi:hypothetical protein